jgi:hypothetical protein
MVWLLLRRHTAETNKRTCVLSHEMDQLIIIFQAVFNSYSAAAVKPDFRCISCQAPAFEREKRDYRVFLKKGRLNSSALLEGMQPSAQPCVWFVVEEGRMKGKTRQPGTVCACSRHAGSLPHDPLGKTLS